MRNFNRPVKSINENDETAMKNLKQKRPELYDVYLKFSNTPGSSVPSETLFSTAGYLVDDRRNRLLPENIKFLIFSKQKF